MDEKVRSLASIFEPSRNLMWFDLRISEKLGLRFRPEKTFGEKFVE